MGLDAKILAMAVASGLVPHEQAVEWADELVAPSDLPSQNPIDASPI